MADSTTLDLLTAAHYWAVRTEGSGPVVQKEVAEAVAECRERAEGQRISAEEIRSAELRGALDWENGRRPRLALGSAVEFAASLHSGNG